MTEEEKKEETSKGLDFIKKNFKIIFVGILVAWVICFVVAFFGDAQGRGTFGDAFGSVNALFSGLAFLGIIYAIVLQREELGLQREELAETRKVFKGQEEQLAKQAQALQKQNFENTFFKFLSLHNDIVESFRVSIQGQSDRYGVECLDYRYSYFESDFSRFREKSPELKSEIEITRKFCEKYFNEKRHIYGRYFQNFLVMLRFIKSYLDKEENMYTDIVRAQLSTEELAFLFYYCLTMEGRDSIKPLVKRYNLISGLRAGDLVNQEHLEYFK